MFEHLDDPNPPTPGSTLAERLRAEGGRRRRRRSRAVGGGLLGGALVALAVVQPWDVGDSRVETLPSDTSVPTTIEPPETTTSTAPEVTSTVPEAPVAFPTDAFAAVTPGGALVLASIETGETLRELDQLGDPLGHDLARAPDGSAVYLARHGTGLWRYTPDGRKARIGAAFKVSVSPDGSRLATVPDGMDGSGRVLVLDAATGDVIHDLRIAELTGNGDLQPSAAIWDATGERLLVEASMPEQGGELFAVELEGSAQRVGPPAGLPSGTGWYLGGPGAAAEAWVIENCCARDANSIDGGHSILRVDTRTGVVLDRHDLGTGNPYLILETGPAGASGFLVHSPHYEGNEGGAMLRGDDDGAVEPLPWPGFLAIDW